MKIGHFTEQDVLNLARKAYDEGEAKFEIVPEKCALLVIDMQDEFVKPHWAPDWVPEATRQVPRIKKLIEHCRSKNIPVIYTELFLPKTNLSILRLESISSGKQIFPASKCLTGAGTNFPLFEDQYRSKESCR